ncbi:25167_t:CDS:1, partial [Gigaspora rosea]
PDNLAGPSYPSTLPPYDETLTQIRFPPRITIPSSPFTEISLLLAIMLK